MTPAFVDDTSVYRLVTRVLAAQLGIDGSTIEPEHRLQEDLGVDSLDVVEMLDTIEDELHVRIAFDGASLLEGLGTVAGVAASVGAAARAGRRGAAVRP
jgi:acyl carrier protein